VLKLGALYATEPHRCALDVRPEELTMKLNDHSERRTLAVNRDPATSAIRRAYRHLARGQQLACDQPPDRLTRAGGAPVDPRQGAIGPDLLAMTAKILRQRHQARLADGRASGTVF
jgi:hypothetical protein